MKQRVYLPTIYEIVYLLTLSLGFLVVSLLIPIFQRINTENYHFLGDLTHTFVANYLVKLDNPHFTIIFTDLLWMIIGAFVYLILWFAIITFKTLAKLDANPERLLG